MRSCYKKVGALWLSLSLLGSYSVSSLETFEYYKNYSMSNVTELDLQKMADKILRSYGFMPPYIKTIKINLVPVENFNAFCQMEEVGDTEINITVYQGLLNDSRNINEVACMLGHEIAHSLLGHVRFNEVYTEDSVNAEAAADMLGQQLARLAGYDVGYAADIWKRIYEKEGDFVGSHPRYSERARILGQSKFWYNQAFEDIFNYGKLLDSLDASKK